MQYSSSNDNNDEVLLYDDNDKEEGFRLLLGDGIIDSLDISAWDNESRCGSDDDDDSNENNHQYNDNNVNSNDNCNTIDRNVVPWSTSSSKNNNADRLITNYHILDKDLTSSAAAACDDDSNKSSTFFSLAFACTENNSNNNNNCFFTGRPPVHIINLGLVKGNALVASHPIVKGQVIYTERAAVACQVADSSAETIKACANCFRSMESIESCYGITSSPKNNNNNNNNNSSITISAKQQPEDEGTGTAIMERIGISNNNNNNNLPMPHLWPVLPLEFHSESNNNNNNTNNNRNTKNEGKEQQQNNNNNGLGNGGRQQRRIDQYGRIRCCYCSSLFCSEYCYKLFEKELGSCCLLHKVITALPKLLSCNNQQQENDDEYYSLSDKRDTSLEEDEENKNYNYNNDGDDPSCVQSSIPLAVRMFAYHLQSYRTTAVSASSIQTNILHGLCGSASELTELELGRGRRVIQPNSNYDNVAVSYTLKPVYEYIIDTWLLSDQEKAVLTCEMFELFATQAARNGFGIRTQSPFQSYYAALLRSTGSRGSSQHERIKQQVIRALGGSNSNKLERGIDAMINRRVAPELAALFVLTARVNHTCYLPNAEVRSQEFVDYHIDIVATRNIQRGEEILISYIEGNQRKTRLKRQRELQAKYLFQCDCPSCHPENKVQCNKV